MYACVMSQCILGKFVSSDPAIFLYFDAVYWGSWSTAFLFIHLSIKKEVSNGDVMWTCFCCFLGCLQSHLTDNGGAKGANIGGSYVEGTFARGVGIRTSCIGVVLVKSACSVRGSCARGICAKVAYTESACTKGAFTGNVCIRGICIKGTCIKGVGTEGAGTEGAGTECAGIKGVDMGSACIQGTCPCNSCIRSACTLGVCITDIYNGTVERSKIYLRLS